MLIWCSYAIGKERKTRILFRISQQKKNTLHFGVNYLFVFAGLRSKFSFWFLLYFLNFLQRLPNPQEAGLVGVNNCYWAGVYTHRGVKTTSTWSSGRLLYFIFTLTVKKRVEVGRGSGPLLVNFWKEIETDGIWKDNWSCLSQMARYCWRDEILWHMK